MRMMNGMGFVLCSLASLLLASCATTSGPANQTTERARPDLSSINYASRIPSRIDTSEKVVIVDPNVHTWGAYDASGELVKAGLATSGSNWCSDLGRACHTKSGSFRVESLGSASCKSTEFPVGRGGAPMPYCMFFHNGQALHGSYELADANISHGCVRMPVSDAEWLRFNFVNIGTKVIVKPY